MHGYDKNKFFTKISQKHIDFLICDKKSLYPLIGIEIDDSSHKYISRKKRDHFVNKLFEVAELPLLRIQNRRNYIVNELKSEIQSALHGEKIEKISEIQKQFIQVEKILPAENVVENNIKKNASEVPYSFEEIQEDYKKYAPPGTFE